MGRSILISSSVLQGRNKNKCDDNVYYTENKFGYFIGLSDGAGSKKYSHLGSKLALGFAEVFLVELLEEIKCNPLKINLDFKKRLIKYIQDNILVYFEEKLENLSLYGGTLLFAQYIKKYDRYLIGHIGDGVIGGIDNREDLKVISSPENGEFSNETFFFTDKDAYLHLRMYWVKGLKGIIMFSDGPEVVLYDKKNKKLAPAVKQLFNWQMELKDKFDEILKENIKVFAEYTHDDLSIILFQKEQTSNVKYRLFKR